MADHPNADLVRQGFNAFGQGDLETLSAFLADDIVWHTAGRGPVSGTFSGKEEVFQNFARILELTGGNVRNDVHAILADDEHAVALIEAHAERDGRTFDGQNVFVFHIEAGQAKEVWLTSMDPYAADEFWAD